MHKLFGLATFFGVFVFAVFAFDGLFSGQQLASVSAAYAEPEFRIDEGAKADILELPVSAFAIFDVESGEVLFAKEADTKLPIASVTKLVTAATVNNNLDLETTTTVTYEDVYTEGRSGKLNAGEEYTYRELLFPLLLESSNDAATVFERVTTGEIISSMNNFVEMVGAPNTSFSDASGLSDKNISTARDLALIASYLYKNNSHIFDITKLSQFVGPYTGWVNNNPVMEDGYLGGKHGYTTAANRTIISIFKEDFAGDAKTLGYVVLGSDNLKSDIATLRQFTAQSIYFQ